MTIHFTSDTHFFHKKMLEFRGFETVEAMHDAIAHSWNKRVAANDVVYHLGDLSFGRPEATAEVLWRLNGRLHIVPGNHDDTKQLARIRDLLLRDSGLTPKSWERKPKFVIENQLTEIKLIETGVDGKDDKLHHVVLCHFPLLVWNRAHYGAIHLHGHSHGLGRYPDNNRRMDVGVDPQGLFPISATEILMWAKARGFTAHDQHKEKTDDSSQGHDQIAP